MLCRKLILEAFPRVLIFCTFVEWVSCDLAEEMGHPTMTKFYRCIHCSEGAHSPSLDCYFAFDQLLKQPCCILLERNTRISPTNYETVSSISSAMLCTVFNCPSLCYCCCVGACDDGSFAGAVGRARQQQSTGQRSSAEAVLQQQVRSSAQRPYSSSSGSSSRRASAGNWVEGS